MTVDRVTYFLSGLICLMIFISSATGLFNKTQAEKDEKLQESFKVLLKNPGLQTVGHLMGIVEFISLLITTVISMAPEIIIALLMRNIYLYIACGCVLVADFINALIAMEEFDKGLETGKVQYNKVLYTLDSICLVIKSAFAIVGIAVIISIW